MASLASGLTILTWCVGEIGESQKSSSRSRSKTGLGVGVRSCTCCSALEQLWVELSP